MKRFRSARDAKEFLVARIVDEAQREGVSLSDVERKMLYFSETGWAPPDIMVTNEEFDRECDQDEYEKKIARIVHHAREGARKEGEESLGAWSDAIRTLRKEDHYLLVMIDRSNSVERPRFDRLKLWATAIALVGGSLGVMFMIRDLGLGFPKVSRDAPMFLWTAAFLAACAYQLFRICVGGERADKLLGKLLGLFLRPK
jgi:hypothetical protein